MTIAARTLWQMQQPTIHNIRRIDIFNLKRVNVSHTHFLNMPICAILNIANFCFRFRFPFHLHRKWLLRQWWTIASAPPQQGRSPRLDQNLNSNLIAIFVCRLSATRNIHSAIIRKRVDALKKKILQIETLRYRSLGITRNRPVNSYIVLCYFFVCYFHQQGKCMWFCCWFNWNRFVFDSN